MRSEKAESDNLNHILSAPGVFPKGPCLHAGSCLTCFNQKISPDLLG